LAKVQANLIKVLNLKLGDAGNSSPYLIFGSLLKTLINFYTKVFLRKIYKI
jgi:hypothetical protein